jgi:hypothetical protein
LVTSVTVTAALSLVVVVSSWVELVVASLLLAAAPVESGALLPPPPPQALSAMQVSITAEATSETGLPGCREEFDGTAFMSEFSGFNGVVVFIDDRTCVLMSVAKRCS